MKILSKAYNYFKDNTKNILSKSIGKIATGLFLLGSINTILHEVGIFSVDMFIALGIVAGAFLLIEILFGLIRQKYPDKKRKNILLFVSCCLCLFGFLSQGLVEKSYLLSYVTTIFIMAGGLGVYLRGILVGVDCINKNLESRVKEIQNNMEHTSIKNDEHVLQETLVEKQELEVEQELGLTSYFKK